MQFQPIEYIDFRSDTVTLPTTEMRLAMVNAVVGDMQYDDDPTLFELERVSAELVGKEDSLFVPSGVMGNQISLIYHAQKLPRGSEVICADESHIIQYETGAAALLAGLQTRPIVTGDGILTKDIVEGEIRKYFNKKKQINIKTALIEVEVATSVGTVTPLQNLQQIYELSRTNQIPVHFDGARIFNAAVFLKIKPFEIAQYCDTIMFCLSKGLGAPIGSILAGTKQFCEEARRIRKQLGGTMRQVGFLAKAALVSYQTILPDIQRDHQIANLLATELAKIQNIEVYNEKRDINMIFFQIHDLNFEDAPKLRQYFFDHKIRIATPFEPNTPYRVIVHHQIRESEVQKFISTLKEFLLINKKN